MSPKILLTLLVAFIASCDALVPSDAIGEFGLDFDVLDRQTCQHREAQNTGEAMQAQHAVMHPLTSPLSVCVGIDLGT